MGFCFGDLIGWGEIPGVCLGKKFTWWSKLDLVTLLSIFFGFVLKFN